MQSHSRFPVQRSAGSAFCRQKTKLSVEALIPLPRATRVFNNIRSISELSAAAVSPARLTVDADLQAGNEAILALSGQLGRIAVGSTAALLAFGCSEAAPPPSAPDTGIDRIIADAVRKTAAANKAVSDLEKRWAGIPAVPSQVVSSPSPEGTEERLFTLRWNGPLESLMRSLAIASGNDFVARGTAPARPVFVSVVADEVSLPEAVRIADQAAFGLASVQFDPGSRRMVIRYPPL